MTKEQARDRIIAEAQAELDEDGEDLTVAPMCRYQAWSLEQIETTLRLGGFPTIEQLEADPHAEHPGPDMRNDPVYNREAFASDGEWLEACFKYHGDEEFAQDVHPVDVDIINHLPAEELAQAKWRATRFDPLNMHTWPEDDPNPNIDIDPQDIPF